MAKVSFKKGLLANLPSALSEGTFYVTTDERALYLDVDASTRVRIGDFQEFATLTALQANTNPSTTALYYVADLNVLAKWNGTQYVQINLDTGATSAEAAGDGNALDGVSYDPATRKLTFTKTKTFTTASDVDSQIAAKVGDLTLGDVTYETVKAYVDKKTDGIATDAALETLTGRVTAAEGDIDTLHEDITTLRGNDTVEGSVSKTVNDAIAALDVTDVRETGKYVSAVQQINGKIVVNRDPLPVEAVYSIAKDADSGDFAAIYRLTRDGVNAGVAINIPKDMVVQSGSVVTNPEGQAAGTYIKLVLQNVAEPLYIDVGSLIEYVTSGSAAGDMVVVTVSDDHKVTAAITDGSITKEKLATAVQTSLDKADTAVQPSDLSGLESKAHEHDNKTVLDGITAAKVAAWDATEQNARDYADGLAGNYDAAGAADAALTGAKDYTDTALTWGSF